MTTCAACGNTYDKSIEIKFEGKSFTFDSFECAIHMLAPICPHCNCRIIGHGVQVQDKVYCCAHCSRMAGSPAINDRV
jgi:hypothetical protein